MNKFSDNEEVVNYYKRSGWLYKYFWHSSKSLALHYGFWNKETKSHDESLINQYKQIIESAQISEEMTVLDAGCGVGGGAIYISGKTGARVAGITISEDQITEAKNNGTKSKAKRVKFELQDYTQTTFPNNYFDVIYGIESVCHAYPKRLFLEEAYRILKPGGILIVSDGYLKREPANDNEKQIISKFCYGWRLEELVNINTMNVAIKDAMFDLIKLLNKTEEVKPSLDRMRYLTLLATPIIWLSRIVPLPIFKIVADNAQSMDMSRKGVEIGLFGYYVIVAVKPKK